MRLSWGLSRTYVNLQIVDEDTGTQTITIVTGELVGSVLDQKKGSGRGWKGSRLVKCAF